MCLWPIEIMKKANITTFINAFTQWQKRCEVSIPKNYDIIYTHVLVLLTFLLIFLFIPP